MNQLDHFGNPSLWAVDFIDYDHRGKIVLDRLFQDKPGLGHGAVDGVHQQKTTIGHVHNSLDLAAEVGVARSVNDVDLGAVVSNGGVLSENRDAAFFFQWIGVHDKHPNVLMSA